MPRVPRSTKNVRDEVQEAVADEMRMTDEQVLKKEQ